MTITHAEHIKPNQHVSIDTLCCAFSYALGRKTYIVSTVIRDLQHNMLTIPPETRRMMLEEISERYAIGALGDQIDVDLWLAFADRLKNVNEALEK